MRDVEHWLEVMRDAPADPRLAEIDDAVMAGVGARRSAIQARRSMALAAAVALGVGVVGTTVPGTPAAASPSASGPSLLGMSDYAPSRLLDR